MKAEFDTKQGRLKSDVFKMNKKTVMVQVEHKKKGKMFIMRHLKKHNVVLQEA
jgi:hypothetical protein